MKKDISVRNFWSLNTDEAIVIGLLKKNLSNDIEIFMPMNSQMKDIDLVAINTKSNRLVKIQVKASKAYLPSKSQTKNFNSGSGTFITIKSSAINNSTADYFVLLLYGIDQANENTLGKIITTPYTLIIPKNDFIKKINEYKNKPKNDSYMFHFWINSEGKRVFDWRDLKKEKHYGDYSEFLDDSGLERVIKFLG